MTRELTWFRIDAVASDVVLARVVVLFGTKGARVHELCWAVDGTGRARITSLVETAPGRARLLTGALFRIVDVLDVQVGASRCAASERPAPVITALKGRVRCASLSTT
ncbi:MAG TPA: hypothetical protein VGL04_02180 [Sporichthyaceae bacterium]|jgi:hypothetical protein